MDLPTSIENIPFMWGVAFSVNVLLALALFSLVIRRCCPTWTAGPLMWIAWWTMANALSLVINDVLGPANPFSYHQMGILTESMVNLGICAWAVAYVAKNWDIVGDKKWAKMDEYRKKLSGEAEQ